MDFTTNSQNEKKLKSKEKSAFKSSKNINNIAKMY